jgi:hypothetical protein
MYKFLTFLLVSLSFQVAFAVNPLDPGLAKREIGAGGYTLPSDQRDSNCTDCEIHKFSGSINTKVDYDLMLMGSGPEYKSGDSATGVEGTK